MNMQQLLDKPNVLPSIPKVVQELINSFNEESPEISDIAKKIALDQVISAKVLRLANSARFGAARQVASIDDAAVRLGLNSLRTLVLASGLTGAFTEVPHLDLSHFWLDSFDTGAIAKELAKLAKLDPETAFTCGMLHNIGLLMIHCGLPDSAKKVVDIVAEGNNRDEVEAEILGFSYPEVGAELAKRWCFPNDIQAAIRYQTQPAQEKAFYPYAALIYLSTRVKVLLHEEEQPTVEWPSDLAQQLGVDWEQVNEKLAKLKESDNEFAELLN